MWEREKINFHFNKTSMKFQTIFGEADLPFALDLGLCSRFGLPLNSSLHEMSFTQEIGLDLQCSLSCSCNLLSRIYFSPLYKPQTADSANL